ncbi:MAG TPA: glycosyltransferase [Candidatus Limnocylindrales bacterium]|nr:glycosyltransferase [Candidatus Limnocylindrales bacterium]
MIPPELSVTVLVPTYRRPDQLRRCLAALSRQTRPPDQLVVVRRADDIGTRLALGDLAGLIDRPIDVVAVTEPGVVHALSSGMAVAFGDVVALTDDDAEPRPDWLERLLSHYADGRVAAVGGLDVQPTSATEVVAERVGVIEPWGRVVGRHHFGAPPARDVDHLRGVNMSARRSWWRFDQRLRGIGAQYAFELDTCLGVRSAGDRVVYDPAAAVDHAHAPRPDDEPRDEPGFDERLDRVHNETYLLLKWLRAPRALAALAYGLVVGTRAAPGPLLVVERLVAGQPPPEVATNAAAGLLGRYLALATLICAAAQPAWRRERRRPRRDDTTASV